MISQLSHPLRAIAPPSVLPEATLHPDYQEIDSEVITYLVNTWDWPSEKAKQAFISWKLSEVVLFMFPTGETSRVKLATELLLLGFLMDDYFDKHTLAENAVIVSALQSLLASPATFTPASTIDAMHAALFARFRALPRTLPILQTYLAMLECHCIPTRGTALASLRDYLSFREVDVGMPICVELLYWADPSLAAVSPAQRESLAQLEKVANFHVSILNDVFSFEREWKAAQKAEGGALVNGVSVLAGEMNVSLKAARQLCLALVRAWEVEFLALSEEVLAAAAADRGGEEEEELLRLAIKGIERRMSGAEAYSWRTARYL